MRPVSWRCCPALMGALCLAAGILLAEYLEARLVWPWLVGLAPGIFYLVRAPRRRLVTLDPIARVVAAVLALVACGAISSVAHRTPLPSPLSRLAHHEPRVLVTGRVADAPEQHTWGWRFVLCLEALQTVAAQAEAEGCLQVRRYDPAQLQLREGDHVQLSGRLEPLPTRQNPGTFDYGRYLRRQGMHALFTADEDDTVLRLGPAARWLTVATVAVRDHVRGQLRRYVPDPETSGVLHALLLGLRHRIGEATIEDFTRTGLLHLLAVSGLHVLLVGLVIYRLLQAVLLRMGLRWRAVELLRALLTLAILGLYMMVTGAAASVTRAVLMAALYLLASLLQRRTHALNILGTAAFLILLLEPMQLFGVGFQLSFSAVAALILLPPVIRARRETSTTVWQRGLRSSAVASLAATAGTLPVLLVHFGRVSLAGLALNILAIPLAMLGLASALLLVVIGGWWPAVAAICASAAHLWIQLLLELASWGDRLFGGLAIEAMISSRWVVAALVMLLLAFAFLHVPRRRWACALASLALLCTGLWVPLLRGDYLPRLRVLFFDVGHGDAALIRFPNGRHLLVDTGPGGRYAHTAERILLPFLRHNGVRVLDAVVITHPHNDHLGGLPALLREMPVRRVLTNGRAYSSTTYATFRHLADSLGLRPRALVAGDTLQIDASVSLQVLAPGAALQATNDASVVLRMVYGQTVWLLLGDAEAAAERELVAMFAELLAGEVIKVAHHGSRTSSTVPLIRHSAEGNKPVRAIISAGQSNRFGLPDEEVVARWQNAGAIVHSTADGALWLESDGQKVYRLRWP